MRNYLTVILMLLASVVFAQVDTAASEHSLHLLAKYGPEGTVLRWGYGEAETWYANFREGVVLERRRVTPNPTEYQAIAMPKLLPEEELLALAAREQDEMVSVIHSMAYLEWENSLYAEGDDDILDKQDNFNNRHALYHFAADRSQTAAAAAGLGYVDRDIEPGTTYAYRVRSQGYPRVVALKVVAPVDRRVRPLIDQVEEQEGAVALRWDRELHNRYFSGYHIERRGETTGWQRLTTAPFVMGYDPENFDPAGPRYFTYRDSVPNDAPYVYRIVGLDAFGDESPPSPPVIGQGRDRTPPPAPVLSADPNEKTHLRKTLNWRQPEGEDVVAYHLQRRFNGKENVVIDFAGPGDTLRIDELDEPGTYVYRLAAQDAAGNLGWSREVWTVVYDRNPPVQPTGLKAETDTSGLIILTWDAAPADDVYGYHVYAADGNRRAYERITNRPHRYRRFVDTVSTTLLNRYRDYYVVATDKDFLYSRPSDTLRVRRPDVIPPAPAQISDFRVTDAGVYLALRPSHSRDAVTHRLLRREIGEAHFTTVGSWTHPVLPPFNQTDTTAERGKTYYYAYQAEDEGGLRSRIVSEVEIAMRPRALAAPVLAGAESTGNVALSWAGRSDAAGWQLYRRIGNGPETRLPTLAGTATDYLDGNPRPGQTVTYRLRLIRQDGRRSPFSEPLEISL